MWMSTVKFVSVGNLLVFEQWCNHGLLMELHTVCTCYIDGCTLYLHYKHSLFKICNTVCSFLS